jgi:DNA-binding transcriptional regulator YhcF (GntR family)
LEKSFSARQENEEQQQEEMTPDNIKQLIDKLIKLPLSGEQIKRYIDVEKIVGKF